MMKIVRFRRQVEKREGERREEEELEVKGASFFRTYHRVQSRIPENEIF